MLLLFCHLLYATPNLLPAIEQSRLVPVSLEQAYGEGSGAFDSRSRHSVSSLNCITWLQWVLAKSYSSPSIPLEQYLDAIRYYDYKIGFNHRKHFIDRWLIYEPAPLIPVHTQECSTSAAISVQLQLSQFREKQGYSCSLFNEESPVEHLVVPYISEQNMESCTTALPEGFYVLFMVPNERWLDRWSTIGEMGTVHAMILHRTQESSTVYQASVDQGVVAEESWTEVGKRLSPVSLGYRVFALQSNWSPKTSEPLANKECR